MKSQKRKRVGLLGGSFNPIHLGHLVIADQVFHQLDLDQIYFLPTYESPHVDEKKSLPATDRLAMLERATENHPYFKIEMIELERKGKSYTYDTILALRKKFLDVDYYFIIGADMVEYLPTWYKIEQLSKLVQFVAVKRMDYKGTTKYPVLWVDTPYIAISSSMIRQKLMNGESVRYLVPDPVLDYIIERELYLNE